MVRNVSLLDHLAGALPAGLKLRIYHLSTRPTPSSALFSAVPGKPDEKTLCESHFLTVALPRDNSEGEEVLVYAIEVLIFTSDRLTTVFVSKADSSGFLHLLKIPKGSPSIIRTITTRFLEFIVRNRSQSARLVLSLFARSQNQYLFPGSIENAEKHVLDDRQLIKWWCRTLDPIVRAGSLSTTRKSSPNSHAHVIVPGCDKSETRAFFPLTSRQDPPDQTKWICSYPVNQLAPDASAPPRSLIPRLPDDPKARYLTDLDGEHINEKGQWRSVKSLDQFWEMLSYRQECSAGRLVGFIWVVFEDMPEPAQMDGHVEPKQDDGSTDAHELPLPTASHSLINHEALISLPADHFTNFEAIQMPKSPSPSSPLWPAHLDHPDLANAKVCCSEQDETSGELKDSPDAGPEEARGELVISSDDYASLMDYLLELDFAGQEQAMKETRKWIDRAASLAKAIIWGRLLEGRDCKTGPTLPPAAPYGAPANVNVLLGVRKKRKAEAVDPDSQKPHLTESIAPGPPVVMLSSGLLRKKPKT